jgi:hypothetical protein
MKKDIMNMINIIKGDANASAKLARVIANIPAVELDSIRVWTAPIKEQTGEYSTVEFMGTHAKFDWHDHTIEIEENHNGKLIVKYDSKVIGEIFWSALWGKLEATPNYTELKKAQEYILDCIWKAVLRISAKGRPYEKVALPNKVQYGDCTIWAEGATVFAEHNGETIRVMGNTWRGLCWTACDHRVTEIQNVIKKAFITY